VIQDEVESQLSAMFDGELPVTECELLSRRIDRDENLRARWSRYALIGAAMRSEPVATARSGFARRVNAALHGADDTAHSKRGRKMILSAALSASLVVTVAGLSISLLRHSAPDGGADIVAQAASGRGDPAVALPAAAAEGLASIRRGSNGEPVSYVTPASIVGANTALRTELADFIVAHSEYSTPLMRRNLLSALVSNEDGADNASPGASAPGAPASPAAGALHAVTAASASSR
jgi:sigma-E factor negative regulatory protein RseA